MHSQLLPDCIHPRLVAYENVRETMRRSSSSASLQFEEESRGIEGETRCFGTFVALSRCQFCIWEMRYWVIVIGQIIGNLYALCVRSLEV